MKPSKTPGFVLYFDDLDALGKMLDPKDALDDQPGVPEGATGATGAGADATAG